MDNNMNQPTDISAIEDLMANINFVVDNVDDIYKKTHTRSEYLFYKLGQKTHATMRFFRSPQVKVLAMLVFWALFVTTWVMAAFQIATLSAFVFFGALIAIYTNLTASAVSAIIRDTMVNYYSGMFANVNL